MHAGSTLRRGLVLVALPLVAQLALAGPVTAQPVDGWKWGVADGLERRFVAGPQPFLAGLTAQQQPVLLRLDNSASVLRRAFTTVHVTCTSGARFYQPDQFDNVEISSLRHFHTSYTLPPQTADATTTVQPSGSLTGQVDRTGTRASGTWRLTFVERNATTKAVTDTCTSGLMRFSARR